VQIIAKKKKLFLEKNIGVTEFPRSLHPRKLRASLPEDQAEVIPAIYSTYTYIYSTSDAQM